MVAGQGFRAARAGELAGWCCAGLLALSAHVGAAALFMRDPPPDMPADAMPPAAIMIELAPEAEAVATERTEISPDELSAEAAQPVERVERLEEMPVEDATEAEPVEDTTEEVVEVDEPVEQELAAVRDAEVPLPVARPEPPKEKKLEPARKPVVTPALKKEAAKKPPLDNPARPRQQPRAASKSAVQAQAQVRQSTRNAGRQTASGLFSSASPARWQSRLIAHLERRKRYPSAARSRGERGTVYVRFRVDDGGNVLSVSLAGSSGYPDLDNEVLSLVRRASPIPAPPPGVNKTITAPVEFSAR